MADPQAWQAQFSHQHWFDHSTSRRGIQPQPQPGLDLATVPSHDSDTQTDRGLHHVEYSLPQWQALTTHGSGHTSFNSEASMSQPVSAQLRGSDLGLITPSLPQWQPVQEQFEGSNGLIPPSLPQPQLQAPVPQPVSAQIGGSLNSGLVPSLSQWQPVPVRFRGSASGLIPPPPSQLQAPVSQPVSAPIGGSLSSGLIPSSLPQWQPVAAQSGSSNLGLTPPSLPQLQAYIPHPVSVQLGGSNSGLLPSQPQWQPVLAQFEGPESELIPPSLPQWQTSVPQSVPTRHGGLNIGLSSSQPHWQAPPSFDSQPFHPHYSLSDTHNSESIRTSHKRDSQKFTVFGDVKRARPTRTRGASKIDPIVLLPDVLKSLKELAHKEMVQRVFEIGLFPTSDEITATANAALDAVIASDAHLKRWRTTQEGQLLTSRLKGVVKNIHSDFQKVVPIIVLASHQSLVELLMTNADMQVSQAARISDLAGNVSYFDVTIQLPLENGHIKSVQAPLGHPSVTALLEYMLVTKKYSEYLCTDTGNWQARFKHAFAFSAAMCCGELQKLPHSGWDNAAADDFLTNGVEAAYKRYNGVHFFLGW
ncbi:hypothetical protein BD769DRAFT_1676063 [Suillus cothurnatus]|nr:hypothetical protein BD769DRAFT_1676063 [Suillus cothurnatus]